MSAKRDSARASRDLARARIKGRRRHEWTLSADDYERDCAFVKAAAESGFRLERPQGSSYHHMKDFLEASLKDRKKDEWWDEDFQSFIIESDWARALATGGGDEDGDFPLPYDFTCFEMRISGLRVMLLMGRDAGMMVTGVNRHWYINSEILEFVNGKLVMVERVSGSAGLIEEKLIRDLLKLVGDQVRAVCIALDEKRVFEQVTVKAGEGLNKQRRKAGQHEVRDYHVVRLKPRTERREEPVAGYVRGPLKTWHKRRGHWRHYDLPSSGGEQYMDDDGVLRSRTWINWMFVGDMSGRFIDKEYRL